MINRNHSIPIFLAAVFSVATSPLFLSRAEPGVPNDSATTTVTAPAPVPPSSAKTPTPTATAPPAPAATNTSVTVPAAPSTYTVVEGDSLSAIAKKYGCTVKSLKKANNLTKTTVKPGQVLKIPAKKATAAATTPATAKPTTPTTPHKKTAQTKAYAHAQPVQDFDIPASTFASCPVPDPANAPDAPPVKTSSTTDTPEPSTHVAQLVSPDELSAEAKPKPVAVVKPAPGPVAVAPKPTPTPAPAPLVKPDTSSSSTAASSSSKQSGRGSSFSSSSSSSPAMAASGDWANRFMQQALQLSNQGIEYDENWRPPGESRSWAMDCSNTSRYLYKVTTGLNLPRTASDQYYYLHLQNKAWDVPQASNGFADLSYLKEKLKPGDLLFWENTYRPERQPPITHVMVFLGTNEKGQWLMAGSQSSRGGYHNRRNGGPDIYVFDPLKPSGGYTTWLGMVRHKGRFCAFGRPLEADPSKLSVASNN